FPRVEALLIGGYDKPLLEQAESKPLEVPLGSYLIFLRQPSRTSVQARFERQVYPDRLSGGAPERPYDVAGWTLPMQMGVQVISVLNIAEPESERRLTPVRDEAELRRDLGLLSGAKTIAWA